MDNDAIRKVNTAGIITTIAGGGGPGYSGDGGPATDARLDMPGGVAVDGRGNIYIDDLRNNRIRRIDSTGKITTYAGNGISGIDGDGGPATAAKVCRPVAIGADDLGSVYILDYDTGVYTCNIRKVCAFCNRVNAPHIQKPDDMLLIYPNPFTTLLNIESTNNINSVNICNLLGQTILNHSYNSEQVHLDVSDLPVGIYLIRINGIEVRKFVKE